ncbi:tetratricopeptide repeat protein [Yeosuana marina]|uniref:tetratricopeptide repeat protein n=1 Tax=Yeosuana marina TaxID=1565536 RepID=UPI00141DDDAD|nr:tetratricopeptide repeat protein [Yeosuana marina]
MKRPIIVFLFFCISLGSFSQENKKLDSLLNVFNNQPDGIEKVKTSQKLYNTYKHKNPDEAFRYANYGLTLSKKINYKNGEGLGYLNLAYYYRFLPNIDSTKYYFKKSVKTLKNTKNQESLWRTLNEYAIFETLQGNFNKAIELANQGLEVATKMKHGPHMVDNIQRKSTTYMDMGKLDLAMKEALNALHVLDTIKPENKLGKAIATGDIGRIEMLRGNYKEALKPFNNALNTLIELKNDHWTAVLYIELGNLYWYIEDYDEALKNYQLSYELGEKMNRDDFLASNLANMADIYSKKGDNKKALEYLLKAQAITEKIGSINNSIINYNMLGDIYYRTLDYNKAIYNHTKAIKLADSVKALDVIRDCYSGRSKAYEKTGNYLAALQDQRQYQTYNDSIFNEAKAKQIDELKTQYETEKKEQQILLQEKELDLLKQKSKNENLIRVLLIIGLLFSLAAFYAIRQKLKRNKLEKEKVDAELAFKKKELTTHALHLAKKNEVLEGLKQKAEELKTLENNQNGYQQLIRTINFDLQDDNNWENFSKYFQEVHKDFNSNVKEKFPEVTPNELRLMSLLKMNLSSKEIANILNISPDGIKKARYRLRKKLNINTDNSLQDFVLSL